MGVDQLKGVVEASPPPVGIVGGRVYLFPSIPTSRLASARKTYARVLSDDEIPLVLVDTTARTLWQSLRTGHWLLGARGLLVTNRTIFDGSDWEASGAFGDANWRSIPLDAVCTCSVAASYTAAPSAVTVNGFPLLGSRPHAYDGLRDPEFLSWLAALVGRLAETARGGEPPRMEDIVRSYRRILGTGEDGFWGYGARFYFPDIPEELVRAVRGSYARSDDPDERILFIFKDSGRSDAGLVISNTRVYSRAAGQDFLLKWELSKISSIWPGLNYATSKYNSIKVVIDNKRIYAWPADTKDKHTLQPVWGSVSALTNMIYQLARLAGAPCEPPPAEVVHISEKRIPLAKFEEEAMTKVP